MFVFSPVNCGSVRVLSAAAQKVAEVGCGTRFPPLRAWEAAVTQEALAGAVVLRGEGCLW